VIIRPPDFDELYRQSADPWHVGTSWYEQRKLRVVLASLCRPRYGTAWDPACGTGHLAFALASIADRVLATDASAGAVAISRRTCEAVNVTLATSRLPERPADAEQVDLVVLGEFLYYLPAGPRHAAMAAAAASTAPGAELVGVHWRHRPHDAYASGEQIQLELSELLGTDGWCHPVHHVDADFVLDVLRRSDTGAPLEDGG
jgi:SAM-dependent methyltransferase